MWNFVSTNFDAGHPDPKTFNSQEKQNFSIQNDSRVRCGHYLNMQPGANTVHCQRLRTFEIKPPSPLSSDMEMNNSFCSMNRQNLEKPKPKSFQANLPSPSLSQEKKPIPLASEKSMWNMISMPLSITEFQEKPQEEPDEEYHPLFCPPRTLEDRVTSVSVTEAEFLSRSYVDYNIEVCLLSKEFDHFV